MNINDIIQKKYYEFAKYNEKNIIKRTEIQDEQLSDVEDEDLMHSILIRLLKKFAGIEFEDLETGFETVKDEYFKIRHFAKKQKSNRLDYIELKILPEDETE
jgi:hypothetical protein